MDAQVFASTSLLAGTYNEDHSGITYTPKWVVKLSPSALGGSHKRTGVYRGNASFTFYGNKLIVIHTKTRDSGVFRVSIDGTSYQFDAYKAQKQFQAQWTSPALSTGSHNVVIQKQYQDGKPIYLDGLMIINSTAPSTQSPTQLPTVSPSYTATTTIAASTPTQAPTLTNPPTQLPTQTTAPTQLPTLTVAPTQIATQTAVVTQLPTQTATPTQAPANTATATATQTSAPLPTSTVVATGSVYYVSLSGSDASAGTLSQPWRTIQKAANTLVAGDTVYIRAGTYSEQVRPKNSGNSTRGYITYSAYPGETVVIDGANIPLYTWDGLFHIKADWISGVKVRKSYIRVSGLRIINARGGADAYGGYDVHGIRVDESDHIIIEKNSTYNTRSSGIGVWNSTYVVVDDNDIALACNLGGPNNTPGAEENLTIDHSSYIEVKNNHVHDGAPIDVGWSGGEGINIKNGSHDVKVYNNVVNLERVDGRPPTRLAFGLDAWSTETYNVRFFNNVAYNNYTGFVIESEAGATARDIFVYNNIAYNNIGPGFYIPDWAQNETSLKRNIHFINNTAYGNGYGIFINSAKIEAVVIRNNIFSQNSTAIQIGTSVPQAQIISDHNLIGGDAMFVNPAAGDFHLRSGSIAVDGGSALNAPSVDFDGNPRPRGAGFDIGAFEQ